MLHQPATAFRPSPAAGLPPSTEHPDHELLVLGTAWEAVIATHRRLQAEYDAWSDDERSTKGAESEKEGDAASAEEWRLFDQILAIPAKTLDGLAVKTRILAHENDAADYEPAGIEAAAAKVQDLATRVAFNIALDVARLADIQRAENYIAAARECGLSIFPWIGTSAGDGVIAMFGRDEDGDNNFTEASDRFRAHPAHDANTRSRGVVFDVLCNEFGVRLGEPDFCQKVNARLAADEAAAAPALQAAE